MDGEAYGLFHLGLSAKATHLTALYLAPAVQRLLVSGTTGPVGIVSPTPMSKIQDSIPVSSLFPPSKLLTCLQAIPVQSPTLPPS